MDDWSPRAKRPAMKPKVNMYYPKGDGRDYLISMNQNKANIGVSSNITRHKNPKVPENKHSKGMFDLYTNPKKVNQSQPNLRQTFGSVNYVRFGKDRDCFININSGGFKNMNDQTNDKAFFKQLRNYDKASEPSLLNNFNSTNSMNVEQVKQYLKQQNKVLNQNSHLNLKNQAKYENSLVVQDNNKEVVLNIYDCDKTYNKNIFARDRNKLNGVINKVFDNNKERENSNFKASQNNNIRVSNNSTNILMSLKRKNFGGMNIEKVSNMHKKINERNNHPTIEGNLHINNSIFDINKYKPANETPYYLRDNCTLENSREYENQTSGRAQKPYLIKATR